MPTRPPDTPSDDPPAFTDEPTSVIQVNGQDRDLTPPARPPLPHPSSSQSSRLTPSSRSAGIATGQSTGRLFGSRRGSTSSSIHQIDTIISESPLVQTPEHEHAEYPHQQEALGGAASAPVSSSARSSFDAPRDRDPTPPARPSFQGNSSHQRIATSSRSAGIEPHTQHHARFALPSLLKGKGRADPDAPTPEATASKNRSRSRGRQMNLKALREALVSSVDGSGKHGDDADEEDGEHQHNWREFKVCQDVGLVDAADPPAQAGRYVWPIQLAIPVTLPPTLNATFGSVRYTLKAQVTRVGALTSNLTADTRVELVSSPGVDDTEETDSLVIERMWELQMRYLITVSGKVRSPRAVLSALPVLMEVAQAFPIGSKIPIAIRLNPLAKVKVYRIVATIEEKLSYYAHGRRIARHEGTRRFPLAKAENVAEGDEPALPVLPVFSDNADALLHSPLTPWIINATSNDGEAACAWLGRFVRLTLPTDHAPSLLDPIGPWELETDLQIPNCKSRLHFSCKHPSANMEMTHILKLVLRVERGDREELDSKGQPKKVCIRCCISQRMLKSTSSTLSLKRPSCCYRCVSFPHSAGALRQLSLHSAGTSPIPFLRTAQPVQQQPLRLLLPASVAVPLQLRPMPSLVSASSLASYRAPSPRPVPSLPRTTTPWRIPRNRPCCRARPPPHLSFLLPCLRPAWKHPTTPLHHLPSAHLPAFRLQRLRGRIREGGHPALLLHWVLVSLGRCRVLLLLRVHEVGSAKCV